MPTNITPETPVVGFRIYEETPFAGLVDLLRQSVFDIDVPDATVASGFVSRAITGAQMEQLFRASGASFGNLAGSPEDNELLVAYLQQFQAEPFEEISEDEYGTHPAFLASQGQAAVNAYVLAQLTQLASGPNAPAMPLAAQVDDTANTFSVAMVPGVGSLGEYWAYFPGSEGNKLLTAVGGYVQSGRVYLPGITGPAGIGLVGIGVAPSGSRPASPFATNAEAFTGTATPTPGTSPTLTSFSPTSAAVGATVTITGTNLTGATGISFNGTQALFTVLNATTISTTVPAGATTGRIGVSTPAGSAQSPVDFTVSVVTAPVNQAPSVALSLSSTSVTAGTQVTATAIASDSDGTVNRVEFYDGNNLLGSDSDSPYAYQWTPAAGTHSITAKVYDNGNPALSNLSSVVTLTVNAVVTPTTPAVTSFSPASASAGQLVYLSGTNLGAAQGSSTAAIGGITATVVSWAAASVALVIPASLAPGSHPVVLTIGGSSYAAPGLLTVVAAAQLTLDNVLDASGAGRHLILGGEEPPAIVAGPVAGKNAFKFNGATNLVREGLAYSLPSTYTWQFRFQRTAAQLGRTQVLFARWGDASTGQWQNQQFLCYFDTANKLTFLQQTGTSAIALASVASAAITDAAWHHAAVVLAGGSLSLYLDGQRVAGPVACAAAPNTAVAVPFRIGAHDDTYETFVPLFGALADLEFSNVARYSGASYAVPAAYATPNANTLAALPMDSLGGTYLGKPQFLGNILLRAGFPQASGGWANPDGFLRAGDGRWYFTNSAYGTSPTGAWPGLKWTVWAVVADTLAALLAGNGIVQSVPIQIPGGDENDLAGNGSVVFYQGRYHHYYHAGTLVGIRHAVGDSLSETFATGTTVIADNAIATYADPLVRVKPDGVTLEMVLVGTGAGLSGAAAFASRRQLLSTSTDGVTWSPLIDLGSEVMPGFPRYAGEPALLNISGKYFMTGDGAAALGQPRNVVRWASRNGTDLIPLGKFFGGSGGGTGFLDGFGTGSVPDPTHYALAQQDTVTPNRVAPSISGGRLDMGSAGNLLTLQNVGSDLSDFAATLSLSMTDGHAVSLVYNYLDPTHYYEVYFDGSVNSGLYYYAGNADGILLLSLPAASGLLSATFRVKRTGTAHELFVNGASQGTVSNNAYGSELGALGLKAGGEPSMSAGRYVDNLAVGTPGYIAAYDSSAYLDRDNSRILIIASNSESLNETQPTLSDTGLWSVPIVGLS